MLGDACMRASSDWPQLTEDFMTAINKTNILDYFAQGASLTEDMIRNIGLTTRRKDIVKYGEMDDTFGDVFHEVTGIQP